MQTLPGSSCLKQDSSIRQLTIYQRNKKTSTQSMYSLRLTIYVIITCTYAHYYRLGVLLKPCYVWSWHFQLVRQIHTNAYDSPMLSHASWKCQDYTFVDFYARTSPSQSDQYLEVGSLLWLAESSTRVEIYESIRLQVYPYSLSMGTW